MSGLHNVVVSRLIAKLKAWSLAALLMCGSATAQTPPAFFGVMSLKQDTTPQPQVWSGAKRLWDSTWATAGVNWGSIETARGVYNTTALDLVVADSVAKGNTSFIYTFGSVPQWASGNADRAVPPTDPNDLYTFVSFIVPHLAALCPTCTFSFELWNEANLNVWFNPGDDSGGAVVGATMAAYIPQMSTIIRGFNNPRLKVLSPSTDDFFSFSWMDNFFSLGLASYVDGIDFHPYPITQYFGLAPEQLLNIDQYYQNILAGYGSSLPLLVTEGSWGNKVTDAATQLRYASIFTPIHVSDGMASEQWYAYDGTNTWGQLWNGLTGSTNGLNQFGTAFRVVQGAMSGAVWTSPFARIPATNQIRNPSGSGVVPVVPGACPGGANQGTPPTNWSVFASDFAHGVSTQFVGSGTEGGIPYIDWRVCGTYTGSGSGFAQVIFETSTGVPATVGQYWSTGINARVLTGALPHPNNFLGNFAVNLALNYGQAGGTFLTGGPNIPLPIYSTLTLGNHTQFGLSQTLATSGIAFLRPALSVYYPIGAAFDVTLRFGGIYLDQGSLYSGTFTELSGASAQLVEDAAGGPTSYSPSGTYKYWRDVYSGGAGINGTVTLTNLPLILESTQWGGVPW